MNIKRTKFNVIILGETAVGKTTMIQKKLGNVVDNSTLATIGIDNFSEKQKFDGEDYIFKIYDTAGQEKYKSLTKSVIKLNEGFLLVFSVDDRNTFERVNNWIEDINQIVNLDEKIIFLVGNKIDKPKREAQYEEAEKFANENEMKYFETSAMTGEGIREVFETLYKEVYDKNKNKSKVKGKESKVELKKNDHKKNKKKCCA